MNSTPLSSRFAGLLPAKRALQTLLLALTVAASIPSGARAAESAAPAAAGVITGIVTNKATGNGLIGARVEIPALKLSALVDNTGRYLLNVPPGSHALVASYTGLDTENLTVSVSAGQSVLHNFVMSSSVLMLDAFTVASTKEGLSSAMTQQRNADNLKNVASMDALADLPNMNATELAIRLPGVTFGDPGDEVVESISVRGMGSGMTSITIDGGGMSSFSAQNRNTRMTAFTGNMFESLELTKGQTPDRSVDSLGGGVNFKTRSPLSMREKRRLTYSLITRHAPEFTEQVPLRDARRSHALFNVSYTEKFAAFGHETENLAVSINGFYSENAFGFYRTVRDFQQTNTEPAYLWDYRTTDNYNNRKQQSLSTKFDYRIARNSLLKLNLIYNDAPEPMRRQYTTRAFAGNATTVPNATTSGVVPGWTDRVTTVRAVPTPANATSGTAPAASIESQSTLINRAQRLRHMDLSGEHTGVGPFDIEWAGLWSRTRYRYLGAEGQLVNRVGNVPFIGPDGGVGSANNNIRGPNGETGVGWILDRTQDDLYPQFIQNGGLDFTNPNNYRPSVNGLSTQSGNLDIDLIKEARAHFKYRTPLEAFPLYLKTGGSVRDHTVELQRVNRRWSYLGTQALPTDPSILLWEKTKTGRSIPVWEGAQFIQQGQPVDPTLWREDLYYYESNKLSASNKVNELIVGYYLMASGRVGRGGFLGGVRHEDTDTVGYGRLRSRTLSTTAQQLADPVGSAQRDYATAYENEGSYGENFPSIHLWYDITPNLKGRGSWTTGFGRPSLANAVTALSINENAQTVTFGNPALLPTKAENWDFSLEYYFQPSSSLTLGWFHKTMTDYIVSGQEIGVVESGPDNGFDGEYAGFTVLGNANAGTAFTQGWELSYQQQFRFLPGLLKGLRFNANFTQITAHGDYGQIGRYAKDKDVRGFIPRTVNVSLSWDYRKFSASMSYNYTAEQIRDAYNFTQPSRNRYLMSRELVNASMRYQLRPSLTLTFGVQNIFNEPQIYYRSIPSQMETFLIQGTTITAGVEGRF